MNEEQMSPLEFVEIFKTCGYLVKKQVYQNGTVKYSCDLNMDYGNAGIWDKYAKSRLEILKEYYPYGVPHGLVSWIFYSRKQDVFDSDIQLFTTRKGLP